MRLYSSCFPVNVMYIGFVFMQHTYIAGGFRDKGFSTSATGQHWPERGSEGVSEC